MNRVGKIAYGLLTSNIFIFGLCLHVEALLPFYQTLRDLRLRFVASVAPPQNPPLGQQQTQRAATGVVGADIPDFSGPAT